MEEQSCLVIMSPAFETISGLWHRRFVTTKIGSIIKGHSHNFAHDMVILSGEADVEQWTADNIYLGLVHVKAGDVLPVAAEIFHKITTTTENYSHDCVYASQTEVKPVGAIIGGKQTFGVIAGKPTGWEAATDASSSILRTPISDEDAEKIKANTSVLNIEVADDHDH